MIIVEQYKILAEVRLELSEHPVLVDGISRTQIGLSGVKLFD
jgi:hypothetical protein